MDSNWRIGFSHAKQYLETIIGQNWKTNYFSPDGFWTGAWIRDQVRKWEQGGMKQERVTALRSIGLI